MSGYLIFFMDLSQIKAIAEDVVEVRKQNSFVILHYNDSHKIFVCIFYVTIKTIVITNSYVMIPCYSTTSLPLSSPDFLPGFSLFCLFSPSLISPLSISTLLLLSPSRYHFTEESHPKGQGVSVFSHTHTHWCCITVVTFHWLQNSKSLT